MSSEFFLSVCSNARKRLGGGGRTYVCTRPQFSPSTKVRKKRNWELTLYPVWFGRQCWVSVLCVVCEDGGGFILQHRLVVECSPLSCR